MSFGYCLISTIFFRSVYKHILGPPTQLMSSVKRAEELEEEEEEEEEGHSRLMLRHILMQGVNSYRVSGGSYLINIFLC